MNERRNEPRQMTCIPAGFHEDGDEQDHVALIHDVSAHGANLYTQEALPLGDHLVLALHLDVDAKVSRPAMARVVHCEHRPWESSDFWTWQIGIEFEQPIYEYREAIDALIRRQRAAGLNLS